MSSVPANIGILKNPYLSKAYIITVSFSFSVDDINK